MSDLPPLHPYRLKLEPGEYEHLDFMCALAKDDNGELILAGLTLEESIWYVESSRAWLQNRMMGRHREKEEREKYLALADRHQIARLHQVMQRSAAGSKEQSDA